MENKLYEKRRLEMISKTPLPVSYYHPLFKYFEQRQFSAKELINTDFKSDKTTEHLEATIEYCENEIKRFLML